MNQPQTDTAMPSQTPSVRRSFVVTASSASPRPSTIIQSSSAEDSMVRGDSNHSTSDGRGHRSNGSVYRGGGNSTAHHHTLYASFSPSNPSAPLLPPTYGNTVASVHHTVDGGDHYDNDSNYTVLTKRRAPPLLPPTEASTTPAIQTYRPQFTTATTATIVASNSEDGAAEMNREESCEPHTQQRAATKEEDVDEFDDLFGLVVSQQEKATPKTTTSPAMGFGGGLGPNSHHPYDELGQFPSSPPYYNFAVGASPAVPYSAPFYPSLAGAPSSLHHPYANYGHGYHHDGTLMAPATSSSNTFVGYGDGTQQIYHQHQPPAAAQVSQRYFQDQPSYAYPTSSPSPNFFYSSSQPPPPPLYNNNNNNNNTLYVPSPQQLAAASTLSLPPFPGPGPIPSSSHFYPSSTVAVGTNEATAYQPHQPNGHYYSHSQQQQMGGMMPAGSPDDGSEGGPATALMVGLIGDHLREQHICNDKVGGDDDFYYRPPPLHLPLNKVEEAMSGEGCFLSDAAAAAPPMAMYAFDALADGDNGNYGEEGDPRRPFIVAYNAHLKAFENMFFPPQSGEGGTLTADQQQQKALFMDTFSRQFHSEFMKHYETIHNIQKMKELEHDDGGNGGRWTVGETPHSNAPSPNEDDAMPSQANRRPSTTDDQQQLSRVVAPCHSPPSSPFFKASSDRQCHGSTTTINDTNKNSHHINTNDSGASKHIIINNDKASGGGKDSPDNNEVAFLVEGIPNATKDQSKEGVSITDGNEKGKDSLSSPPPPPPHQPRPISIRPCDIMRRLAETIERRREEEEGGEADEKREQKYKQQQQEGEELRDGNSNDDCCEEEEEEGNNGDQWDDLALLRQTLLAVDHHREEVVRLMTTSAFESAAAAQREALLLREKQLNKLKLEAEEKEKEKAAQKEAFRLHRERIAKEWTDYHEEQARLKMAAETAMVKAEQPRGKEVGGNCNDNVNGAASEGNTTIVNAPAATTYPAFIPPSSSRQSSTASVACDDGTVPAVATVAATVEGCCDDISMTHRRNVNAGDAMIAARIKTLRTIDYYQSPRPVGVSTSNSSATTTTTTTTRRKSPLVAMAGGDAAAATLTASHSNSSYTDSYCAIDSPTTAAASASATTATGPQQPPPRNTHGPLDRNQNQQNVDDEDEVFDPKKEFYGVYCARMRLKKGLTPDGTTNSASASAFSSSLWGTMEREGRQKKEVETTNERRFVPFTNNNRRIQNNPLKYSVAADLLGEAKSNDTLLNGFGGPTAPISSNSNTVFIPSLIDGSSVDFYRQWYDGKIQK